VADEMKSLFEEFEEGKTPEAKFVREIDTFECLLQAVDYEHRASKHHRLHEFVYLESRITSPDLRTWTELLAQERGAISSKRSAEIVIIFVIGKYRFSFYCLL
jgi:5'-deoxynucleotidase YfbR-like HD superfamily hydrolase